MDKSKGNRQLGVNRYKPQISSRCLWSSYCYQIQLIAYGTTMNVASQKDIEKEELSPLWATSPMSRQLPIWTPQSTFCLYVGAVAILVTLSPSAFFRIPRNEDKELYSTSPQPSTYISSLIQWSSSSLGDSSDNQRLRLDRLLILM